MSDEMKRMILAASDMLPSDFRDKGRDTLIESFSQHGIPVTRHTLGAYVQGALIAIRFSQVAVSAAAVLATVGLKMIDEIEENLKRID